MEHLKMHSPNMVDQNIEKLAELFPGCVTEAQGEDGKLRKAIDFDLLKQELSRNIVEGPQERYQLNWPGKREALLTANAPIAKTLRPCREDSVDFDTTQNLFIEGDNLDALKLLQETYLGKVKMIYIDPPYNTGNDFIYEDDFAQDVDSYIERSNQIDEEGNRLTTNTDSNGRFHSDWLSMIHTRIKLASNLLSDDGVFFASIDSCECHNLKKILDEIFGEDNFVVDLIWKSRQIIDSRNKTNASSDHEVIFVYTKKKELFSLLGKEIDTGKYKNPDNDPRGPWMSDNILGLANASQRPNLHYPITDPSTGIEYPCSPESGWRYSVKTMQGKIDEGRIIFPKKVDGRPREKKFLEELKNRYTGFSSVLSPDVGYTLNGTREVRELLGGKIFDFPKPKSLIKALINQANIKDGDIVLDFFSGSGTTAHALMCLNSELGRKGKFIAVQIPEPVKESSDAANAGFRNLADVSKERIRRAGKMILKDSANTSLHGKLDIGFRVLKIDSSNMADVYYQPDTMTQEDLFAQVDNVKEDRTEEDLLFQVMLDWGVDLT
ncbi:site-specific DNA-methyltransferase, partial [Vibrio lentus]